MYLYLIRRFINCQLEHLRRLFSIIGLNKISTLGEIMPGLPVPGMAPGDKDLNIETNDKEEREDLWSPEYSEEQRAVVASMIEITTALDPENEQQRVEDMARILEDSLAHMGFKGVDIPQGVQITKDITDAIAYAISAAIEIKPEILQPLMEERLEKMGVSIDQITREQLGLIAYVYKITSMRGNDGYDRSPYSEVKAARATVDILVAKVAQQEGPISADDVIKELSLTNIKIGKKHNESKGRGKNKLSVEVSAWEATKPNTQELIRMILTEVAERVNGNVEIDEDGKPYVLIGEGGTSQSVEGDDIGEQGEILEEEDSVSIDMMVSELLQNETEESLRANPSEVGGLVLGINENAEDIDDLNESEQQIFKSVVLDAARRVFPNAVLEKTEKGLFLTIK